MLPFLFTSKFLFLSHFLSEEVAYFILPSRYVDCCPAPPVSMAEELAVSKAASFIAGSRKPLLIIGKGNVFSILLLAKKSFDRNFRNKLLSIGLYPEMQLAVVMAKHH